MSLDIQLLYFLLIFLCPFFLSIPVHLCPILFSFSSVKGKAAVFIRGALRTCLILCLKWQKSNTLSKKHVFGKWMNQWIDRWWSFSFPFTSLPSFLFILYFLPFFSYFHYYQSVTISHSVPLHNISGTVLKFYLMNS